MNELKVGDFVKFSAVGEGEDVSKVCFGNITRISKFKATVETITKYDSTPMKKTLHVSAFTPCLPEDVI